jgi:hypothetical protein
MSWILLSSLGLELDQRFSGHPSAMFHLDALRLGPPADRSAVCPVAGVLRAPGLVARHRLGPPCRARAAPAHPAAPGACPAFNPMSCLVLFSPERTVSSRSVSLLREDREGQRVGQDGVSDSDPRTLAEYVRHCPKIVVR